MQLVPSKNSITVKTNSNKVHKLQLQEYTRWICLVEALDYISKKAGNFKYNLQENDDWIKPLAFQKYISERYESMLDEISLNEFNTMHTVPPSLNKEKACTTSLEPASL